MGTLAWAALLGLGVSRRAEPGAIALSATALVFGPGVLVGLASDAPRRLAKAGAATVVWASFLFATLPLYFPGERRDAVTTGLALLTGNPEGDGMARTVAEALPDEPDVAVAQVPQARGVTEVVLPPPVPLADHEIALPYEGEGRRLSVPVVFEHGGRTVETFMMLDTGATYTTLPTEVLAALDALPPPDAPELTLNTANGARTAQVVLLDQVWLGDLPLDGVAVTTCEDCANDDNAGLLGLNITGAYNVTIDADRREVVMSRRKAFTRRLDVRPFSDLQARFVRYAGGRVEVELDLVDLAPRPIRSATAKIACDDQQWLVDLGAVVPGGTVQTRERLPRHERCASYQISLEDAQW